MNPTKLPRRDFLKTTAASSLAALAGPLAWRSALAAGGTLKVAVSSDAWSLDVRACSDVTGLNVCKQLYNGLMNYDPDGNLFPDLAEAPAEQPDDRTYIYKLRQGVQFHGGHGELTADDVVYTFDAIRGAIDTGLSFFLSLWLGPLEKVEALDKHTVKFTMSAPYGGFPDATALCKIVSKSAAEKHGKDFARNPVGTGPFELVEWVKDDHITLKRFDQHFRDGVPKIDGVHMQIIPDDTVKVTNLITDQVHMIKEIPPRNLAQLKNAPGIVVGQRPGTQTEQLYFRTDRAPFNDVNLRRAVAFAIDREAIAEKVFFGMAQPAIAPLQESQMPQQKFPDGMTRNVYNPDKAREFLAKSSQPKNFKFTCLTTAQGWFVEQLTVIQATLKDVGIEMVIEPMEKSAMFARQRAGDLEASYEDLNAAYFGYNPATPVLFYTPPSRALAWNDEHGMKADKLLQQFMTTLDVGEQQRLYGEFLEIVTDQVPYTQVVFVDSTDAWRDTVKNYKVGKPNDSMWWETTIG